ncbi:hypothetical protein, partial [Enhygromyxa salina]|uniref:hypothetical protein n=1 Tax=Enhygromyxa salina TaxID=215803 RepID=UPI001C62D027
MREGGLAREHVRAREVEAGALAEVCGGGRDCEFGGVCVEGCEGFAQGGCGRERIGASVGVAVCLLEVLEGGGELWGLG